MESAALSDCELETESGELEKESCDLMDADEIEQVVEDFSRSKAAGVAYPPAWFDRLSLEEGRQVQLGLLGRELAAGARHVGWKVGLTAQPIREQFHVHEPVFGYLLDRGLQQTGFEVLAEQWIEPAFENELCLRLGSDLRGPGVDLDMAREAVELCYPAIELVENRGDFTAQLAVAVADNVQQRAFVVGAPVRPADEVDFAAVQATVRINGAEVARGAGSAVMGNPLESVVWLANTLVRYGRHIAEGDYVMTGSFTRQFPLRPGDAAETTFDGIGTVSVRCASP